MFTGLVEEMGPVLDVRAGSGLVHLTIGASFGGQLAVGDSVSINGACLTVVEFSERNFSVEAVPETLRRTNLGQLTHSNLVNLERAMPANGRLGGHFVQGHVDCTVELVKIEGDGGGLLYVFANPVGYAGQIVEKGYVTLDGASLTVAGVDAGQFKIALIPHTLHVTTFGGLAVGDRCNLETDILAKYVSSLVLSTEVQIG